VDEDRAVCVGLDTHKAEIAVAVAEPGRAGEVRFRGEIASRPEAVRRLLERLADKHGRLRVCPENRGEAAVGSGYAARGLSITS
jgi:transposase